MDAPIWMLLKVVQGLGFSNYNIAQFQHYLLDYQENAFGVNAPTDVVRTITGREPEEYETITRRYVAHTPQTKRSLVTQVQLLLLTLIWMLRQVPERLRILL